MSDNGKYLACKCCILSILCYILYKYDGNNGILYLFITIEIEGSYEYKRIRERITTNRTLTKE